jgi:hypothetical protein
MPCCLRSCLAMIQPAAALPIARRLCALLVACSLTLFTASGAAAQAQDPAPPPPSVITFKCDSSNSNPSPNQNTCFSVFKKAPGRIPTYDRVAISSAACKTSLWCWTNATTVTNKCKVIPARGAVPPTSQLPNCPQ